jgi:polygalacturonase
MKPIKTSAVLFGLLCLGMLDLAGCASSKIKPVSGPQSIYGVCHFGATGDGHTLDTAAINRAIIAANAAGGGMVWFPAGTYLSTSIRLKSNVTLYLGPGAVIEAASETVAPYDPREFNASTKYQDQGHSHWHDSLIWGENLENVSITGPGLIYGKGLYSGHENNTYKDTPPGSGNKAIALVNCHNVILRDFGILHGGWFGILATGVNNLTIDNLRIDTNRDGMDIDCCRNVRIVNCSVNSPWDDGICLKSSYALNRLQATENVTINNCFVTGGLVEGTLIDGTFERSPPNVWRTGRIKLGTESNGGFKNIAIANCVFDDSRGLAIESVDGGDIEDVTINNLIMRHVANAPIFIRLGSRLRGPDHPPVGVIRRINISDMVVSDASQNLSSIISGIPGHPVENVHISNVQIVQRGGGTAKDAALQPPEKPANYPEPAMFGTMPAYGFYIRHARGVELDNVQATTEREDMRPAFVLDDVIGVNFQNVKFQLPPPGASTLLLRNVENFNLHQSPPLPDAQVERTELQKY